MNNVSAKSIQMFVAGALALMGFQPLVWLPYYLVVSKSIALAGGSIFSGLALVIGVAMFLGKPSAARWAQVYLWLGIVGAVAMIFCILFHVFPMKETPWSLWRGTFDLLASVILLLLLVWSRSKHFRDEPDV
jgi:hypothetical protein